MAEDGKEPKTEPEVKKSKAGAKANGKKAAGDGESIQGPPSPQMGKPCPVANRTRSRSAPGMWVGFKSGLRRKVETG